jgi:hypothetical protein
MSDGYFWEDMSEDEIQAHIARKRAEADAALTAHLEQMAAGVPDRAWPPTPNTEHPSLADIATGARLAMARGEHQLRYMVPQRVQLTASLDDPLDMPFPEQRVLDVRRARGMAPWTDEPYWWEWKVAVEPKTNRWVAGDSYAVRRDSL